MQASCTWLWTHLIPWTLTRVDTTGSFTLSRVKTGAVSPHLNEMEPWFCQWGTRGLGFSLCIRAKSISMTHCGTLELAGQARDSAQGLGWHQERKSRRLMGTYPKATKTPRKSRRTRWAPSRKECLYRNTSHLFHPFKWQNHHIIIFFHFSQCYLGQNHVFQSQP